MPTFFKPTRPKLFLAAALAVGLLIVLTRVPIPFLPCKIQPVVPNPLGYRADVCSSAQLAPFILGISLRFNVWSWVVDLGVFGVLPYLAASAILAARK